MVEAVPFSDIHSRFFGCSYSLLSIRNLSNSPKSNSTAATSAVVTAAATASTATATVATSLKMDPMEIILTDFHQSENIHR